MATTANLRATPRDDAGKGVARKLRGSGRVPAVLYGHGDEPRALSVDAHELKLLIAGISVENTIIRLDIDGVGAEDVLIREVQTHPYRPDVLHVDFFHIRAGETLRLQIPIRLLGTATGVRDSGGVLDHVLYDLEVECLPRNIPEAVEIDISGLEIGDSVRVGDVEIEGVKLLQDPTLPIASVVQPTKRVEEEEETLAAEAEGVEPEVIGRETGETPDAADEE